MIKRFGFIVLVLLSVSPVLAAPSLFRSKAEPVERTGTTLQERRAPAVFDAFFAPALYPAAVNILFLRVEFQKTDGPESSRVTGSGLWLDPVYTHGTGTPVDSTVMNDPSNFWVSRAKTNFINYWSEVSYGLLTITIDISPKVYQLPYVMPNYGNESNASLENLIYDSITTASTDTQIDFSQYDAVMIVHAGAGEESDTRGDSANDLWSLYYSSDSIAKNANPDAACSNCLAVTLKDGKRIKEAIIMPQTDSQDGLVVDPLGVYVHEFGHWLGLPDLYCTGVFCQANGPEGVGKWSLMGDGLYLSDPASCQSGMGCWYGSSPAHLDAWSKVFLGWVSPTTLTPGAGVGSRTMNPIETSQEIIRVQASSSNVSQYFLIENRQQSGYDAALPGHGLLVWLVDDDVVNNALSTNTLNTSRQHPGVKLIQADNDWSLLTYGCGGSSNCGKAGDPFPGTTNNTELTPLTVPASTSYAPHAWVNIRNITESAGIISTDIGFGPDPPHIPGISANRISWMPNPEADVAYYKIFKNGDFLMQTTTTSFVDPAVQNGDAYQLAAVSAANYESDRSGQVIANTSASAGGSDSNTQCFIATAAYGSALDPHVQALRTFRDRYLMTTAAGRGLVSFYYRTSPPLADVIRKHESLRIATRMALMPIVLAVEFPMLFAMVLVFAGVVPVVAWRVRREKS